VDAVTVAGVEPVEDDWNTVDTSRPAWPSDPLEVVVVPTDDIDFLDEPWKNTVDKGTEHGAEYKQKDEDERRRSCRAYAFRGKHRDMLPKIFDDSVAKSDNSAEEFDDECHDHSESSQRIRHNS
jgi:hypothetical protein